MWNTADYRTYSSLFFSSMPLDEALVCMGLVAGKESAKSKDIFMHLLFVLLFVDHRIHFLKAFYLVFISYFKDFYTFFFLLFVYWSKKSSTGNCEIWNMKSFHGKAIPYRILFFFYALFLFRLFCYSGCRLNSNAFQSVGPDSGPGMQQMNAQKEQEETHALNC
jgi:hypothetical protein